MANKGNPFVPSGSDTPSAEETIRDSLTSKILSLFGASRANYNMPNVNESKIDSVLNNRRKVRRRFRG